jgi:alkylation response protein AidB-like acyl-CoA dehydrogenase
LCCSKSTSQVTLLFSRRFAMSDKFGDPIPFAEPYWYQGYHSPHYHEGHKKMRALIRKFVDEEIKPHVDDWIKTGYPPELHKRAYELGIQGIIYPKEYGGNKPADYDPFYELIIADELARGGAGVLAQMGINSMALPPIFVAGSEEIKNKVCRDVVMGKKFIGLAISEPWAGSDVANIQTTAKREGDYYIVNGVKKWITGGLMADFFTCAVRTGGPGMAGVSLLLLEKDMPGLKVRKMETQFDNAHNTTMVTLDDVKVPVSNLIGDENQGFMLMMLNFNHERFVIAAGTCRESRICYQEAFRYALQRKTFGKRLIDHQIIRWKLAEMARMIEALYDNLERVTYQFKCGVPDLKMGGQCALLKVNASKCFEFCAREASQIFGGASVVKEGQGKIVERLYRNVRASAIPGGSEEILLDFTMRQAAARAANLKAKM